MDGATYLQSRGSGKKPSVLHSNSAATAVWTVAKSTADVSKRDSISSLAMVLDLGYCKERFKFTSQ